MTKIDKPANEPEVAMARWDESHVDIDNDTFVGRGGHTAMRDRIAELEQVAIDQAEKIAALRDRIAELEQVAIDQAEKIASVWGSE